MPDSHTQAFELRARGYADSTISMVVPGKASVNRSVAMRPLLGALDISTEPPGATLTIDGVEQGTTPNRFDLHAQVPVEIEIRLEGYRAQRVTRVMQPRQTDKLSIVLEELPTAVVLESDPGNAAIRIDGELRGMTPRRVELPRGSHHLTLSLAGFVSVDTTVMVRAMAQTLSWPLKKEPNGFLIVQGDQPASIYVNDNLIVENVQNSGVLDLPPGNHKVHTALVSGEVKDVTVSVKSRVRTTYDYSSGAITQGQ